MSVVEGDIVDIGRHEIQQGGHRLPVMSDGARQALVGDVIVVGILEVHFTIRLTDIVSGVCGHHIQRWYQPHHQVALVNVIAKLGIHVILKTNDGWGVPELVVIDTIQYQRISLVNR